MKTTTPIPPTQPPAEQPPHDAIRAFDAGIRAATPTQVAAGVYAHHKDIGVTDRFGELVRELKMTTKGPPAQSGTITIHTLDSMAAIYRLYSDPRTRVFADTEGRRITCVFDYLDEGKETPGWGQFRAVMNLAQSRKLSEWKTLDAWQDQTSFANFLEDHLEDVVIPYSGDLLSMVTDLEANSSGSFKGRVNLANGSTELRYLNDVETTVQVPKTLTLGVPLFEHGDPYRLPARLRFNVASGGVRFRVLLTNLEDAIQTEFERIAQELEEKIGSTIIRGSVAMGH